MSEPTDRSDSGRRRRATRKRRPSLRWVLLGLGVVVLLLLGAVGWGAYSAYSAKNHLEAAKTSTDQLRASLTDDTGDAASRAALLADIQDETSTARALTSGPVWSVAGALPVVGDSADAVSTTVGAVDQVAQQVLPTLVAQSDALSPSSIRVAGNQLDLAKIEAAAPSVAAAQKEAAAAAARAGAVDTDGLPARLGSAIADAQDGLDELASLTTNASDAARLMPAMLGADGPRRYLLAFQSNAESRATGGLIGAYAVLEADEGRLRVEKLGPRTALDRGNLTKPAIDLGPEYRALYGDDPGLWVNTNLSPHFPYAAQLWLAMYEKQTGTKLDGAITTDPVALGKVLGATGPAMLPDGTQVTSENAAKLTMSDVYARFPDDDAKRDAFLQAVARAVMTNLLTGQGDASDVASAFGAAAGEGRLLVYSADPAEQKLLLTTPLGGSAAATAGPQVGVFANSGSASKLDYYLDAQVDYRLATCTGGADRNSSVTLTLKSTAPASGLPTYVTGPKGAGGQVENLDLMAVHLPVGATVSTATIDGKPLALSPHTLLGRPVVTFPVRLDAGQQREIVLELSEPASSGEARATVQPFATPARVTVEDPGCRV